VQVTLQPSLVISTLHIPIVRLQQQTVIPFIITQQLTIPPAIMLQRFCIMLQAVGSSQRQVIFMPPAHFSNFMVQRGTIIQFALAGIPVGAPTGIPVPIVPPPGMVIPVRSIIVMLDMADSPFLAVTPTALKFPRSAADPHGSAPGGILPCQVPDPAKVTDCNECSDRLAIGKRKK
jgi:hypothetical protein